MKKGSLKQMLGKHKLTHLKSFSSPHLICESHAPHCGVLIPGSCCCKIPLPRMGTIKFWPGAEAGASGSDSWKVFILVFIKMKKYKSSE